MNFPEEFAWPSTLSPDALSLLQGLLVQVLNWFALPICFLLFTCITLVSSAALFASAHCSLEESVYSVMRVREIRLVWLNHSPPSSPRGNACGVGAGVTSRDRPPWL